MSKTFNNYISLTDSPNEVFGKAMSIPDDLILSYMNLTDTRPEEMHSFSKQLQDGVNPRDIKLELAFRLVQQLHNLSSAFRWDRR